MLAAVDFCHLRKSYAGAVMRLTLHGHAGGFGEERDEQQVQEVDEGQSVVSEQTCCREKKKNIKKHVTIHV